MRSHRSRPRATIVALPVRKIAITRELQSRPTPGVITEHSPLSRTELQETRSDSRIHRVRVRTLSLILHHPTGRGTQDTAHSLSLDTLQDRLIRLTRLSLVQRIRDGEEDSRLNILKHALHVGGLIGGIDTPHESLLNVRHACDCHTILLTITSGTAP
nr:MAG TPA: hypothetical protein [Caudoviricetes sp.]